MPPPPPTSSPRLKAPPGADVAGPWATTAAEAARYARTLQDTLAQAEQVLASQRSVWIFGYASLIWRRPEFDAIEQRAARVTGWHRALRMRSRVNRGCEQCPGLVFALLQGGACAGMAYRLSPERYVEDLTRLWQREMPLAAYTPRWLSCRAPQGDVKALTFTLDRKHPSHTGPIDDAAMVDILRNARGRYGTTLEYLMETQRGLQGAGIRDAEVDRLAALARHAGLA
jgi:glutathione-specific gamma-glutamylcyclotransferase